MCLPSASSRKCLNLSDNRKGKMEKKERKFHGQKTPAKVHILLFGGQPSVLGYIAL